MNSGTVEEFIGDVVDSVEVVDGAGKLWLVPGEENRLRLPEDRVSRLGGPLSGAIFVLPEPAEEGNTRGNSPPCSAEERYAASESAPVRAPSSGIRLGGSVGRMIEEAGLKGLQAGDAEISEVHGNFIVNKGRARARDIERLMEEIRRRVGPDLEMEIHRVGGTG